MLDVVNDFLASYYITHRLNQTCLKPVTPWLWNLHVGRNEGVV
jgi:hypothetical protein